MLLAHLSNEGHILSTIHKIDIILLRNHWPKTLLGWSISPTPYFFHYIGFSILGFVEGEGVLSLQFKLVLALLLLKQYFLTLCINFLCAKMRLVCCHYFLDMRQSFDLAFLLVSQLFILGQPVWV